MADTWRLFIAIELPPNVRSGLIEIQTQLKKQAPAQTVRWVNPNGIHLTLKFLGDAPVAQIEALKAGLNEAVRGHLPFKLAASGLGCFPNAKKPRVAWVGLQQELDRLAALRDAVEASIVPLGYPTEDRAFSPHLTLGRVRQEARRDDVQRFGELIAHASFKEIYEWEVTGVSLIRSELKPDGAIYTTLFHAPLAPNASG